MIEHELRRAQELALAGRDMKRPYTIDREEGLQTAVARASKVAESGDIVLLAPGGTSFDEFKDFEERGDRFQSWVQAL